MAVGRGARSRAGEGGKEEAGTRKGKQRIRGRRGRRARAHQEATGRILNVQ